MPAPNIIDFAAHPADYVDSKVPWWIQEDMAEGTTFTPTSHSTHVYVPGGQIERVIGSFIASRADAEFLALVAACDPSIADPGPAHNQTWSTSQTDFDLQAGDGFWPSGQRYAGNLYVAWQRTTDDLTIGADTRVWWGNLVVVHKRYSYGGGLVDTTTDLPLDVQGLVHDLMGRGLNALVEYDPNRTAPGTPWGTVIPHAAWWDGVSAREVLTYGCTYAPNMWWRVLDPGPSGLPRFDVGRWDGPPRYVIAPGDGVVELSGGAASLANECLVRYVGTTFGSSKTAWVASVRANVRALAAAGLTRTMVLDITGEGLMSPLEARLRGISALRQASLARTAGKVTIRQPILDRIEGRMVEPWEVQPGNPVIVSDAPLAYSRSTSLVDSVSADGVAVFRAAAMSYDASRNEATLDLDGGYRSLIGRLKVDAQRRRYDVSDPRT